MTRLCLFLYTGYQASSCKASKGMHVFGFGFICCVWVLFVFFFNCSLFLSSFQCLKTEDIKFVIEFFVCVWVVLLQESVRSLIGT